MKVERILTLAMAIVTCTSAYGNTAIETETAQLGKQGEIGTSNSLEYEHAKDGDSLGTLTQFEYAITDRSEILIEPFFYQWELPKDEPHEHGVGDLEITPSYMLVQEDGWVPAIVPAFKIKVPTGSKKVGNSGKTDYFPYVIFGQHARGWTFNANLGLNFEDLPSDGHFHKKVVWDLEGEHDFQPDWTTFFEVFSSEDGIPTVSTALQHQFTQRCAAFVALSYTKEHSVIFRPGINFDF